MTWRIGIDLGGTKIEGLLLDPDGRERMRRRRPTPRDDYDGTLRTIGELVAELEQRAADRCSVGVGAPGAIDPGTGLIKNANSTWLQDRPLDVDLCRALGRPVALANDADCFALSEATDGAAAGYATLFGVILGTGVGGGIVVDGRLVRGPNAIAGEWGHSPLPWPEDDERPGPACYCGKHGCIESFLSGSGLAPDRDAQAVVARAQAGDESATRALERYIDRLARSLATVINLLDPHAIVLGGGLSKIEALYERVPERWGRYVFSPSVRTALLRPLHGDSSGVRGAARLQPE